MTAITLPLQPGMELREDRGIFYASKLDPRGRFLVWELRGATSIPIVLDGALDLVIDPSGEEEPTLMGLIDSVTHVDLGGANRRWLGVRFFPGWFAAFTGADLAQWPRGDAVSWSELQRLRRRLAGWRCVLGVSPAVALDTLFRQFSRAFELLDREPAADVQQVFHGEASRKELLVGERQLRRIFRQQTGFSWRTLAVLQRSHRAARLLLHGHPMADVVQQLGYADQAHLTRHFSRVFGFGPARMSETFKKSRPPRRRLGA